MILFKNHYINSGGNISAVCAYKENEQVNKQISGKKWFLIKLPIDQF